MTLCARVCLQVLETLWVIKPVNPKADDDEMIGIDEKFHFQHVSTKFWLHAKDEARPPPAIDCSTRFAPCSPQWF